VGILNLQEKWKMTTQSDRDMQYEEGDNCPKCKIGILVIKQNNTGWNDVKCQYCNYLATDDDKDEKGGNQKI